MIVFRNKDGVELGTVTDIGPWEDNLRAKHIASINNVTTCESLPQPSVTVNGVNGIYTKVPFDFKVGDICQTRDGQCVKIAHVYGGEGTYPIEGVIENYQGNGYPAKFSWTLEGKFSINSRPLANMDLIGLWTDLVPVPPTGINGVGATTMWTAGNTTTSVAKPFTSKEDYAIFVDETFAKMSALIRAKNSDYCASNDAFENFRTAEEVGVTTFQGLNVRLLDKVGRIKSFVKHGKLENEGIEDAYLDLIGYSMLALGILNEQKGSK